MDLCDVRTIKDLLARHGFRFSKRMGQNFLIESWVPAQIAQASQAGPDCGVLEIGPGIGPLTVQLAQRAGRVACVELDRSLLPILAETLASYDNIEVISGDVLKLDLPALADRAFSGLTPLACANLPYNITTPAITALLQAKRFACITVMIQREVAKRICAAPGQPDYGAFSVFCQYHAQPELLFEVPAACFLPAPKVTSAVLRLTPRQEPAQNLVDEEFFFRVVRASFAQRRKTLLNGLSAAFGAQLDKQALSQVLQRAGLSGGIRGERLDIGQFALLAAALQSALNA